MAQVALVSARMARDHDDDLAPLLGALGARGISAAVADWDDPDVDWAAFDLALIRSTWDYTYRLDEFSAWLDRAAAATRLVNDVRTVRWNLDKRYLHDLESLGVDVVATRYVGPGDEIEMPTAGEFVVKPTVSAGSRDTSRYVAGAESGGDAAAHVARLVAAGRTAMIQPYQRSIDERGETALLYFGGRFSHAAGKAALLTVGEPSTSALFAPESITARDPEPGELAVGDAVLAALERVPALDGVGPPLYARVDVVLGDDDVWRLLELELIEPSVFSTVAPGSAERFAAAIDAEL